ncbi:MAG: Hsp33 family molecular chaperone HslO, partial [Acidobacteria bacterium]|nr:Hsp33 family molecular chaperone HslO [Acidobacteriota bacterium]
MTDRLIQGMAGVGDFRVIGTETTRAVEQVRTRADMSPVATIAIGRAMTGALLLARLLDKNQRDQQVTIRIDGGGPLGLIVAEANTNGYVRGFVANPKLDMESLEVGKAVGKDGILTVVRTAVPTGKPYSSQIRLVTGEIARDLTEYLLVSEQVQSAVLLGVQVSPDGVEAAGGVAIQRFPHAGEPQAESIEDSLSGAPAFSSLLAKMPLEDAIAELLPGRHAQASIYAFDLVERRAKRGVGIPAAEPRRIQKVGIVGAGLMATQLATLFLRRLEVPIVLRDLEQAKIDDA